LRFKILIFSFFISVISIGQTKNLPLNHELNYQFQEQLLTNDTLAHGSMRPYIESMVGIKEAPKEMIDSGLYYYTFTQKLWQQSLFIIKGKDYRITIDPLGNFRGGHDISDTLRFMVRNSRALRIQVDLDSNFSFETFIYENQAKMPRYIAEYATQTGTLPSEGRVKVSTNGADILDFGVTMGYLSYSPRKNLNFQLGHGKQFVGNGYRSMILSDYSFNHPYIKSTWNFGKGKFQYSSTFTQLSSVIRLPEATTPEATFKEKFGNLHYLTFKPNSKFEIGIFEGGLFRSYVDSVGTVPLHFSAYSPILGTSLALNGFESENNVVLGVNLSYQIAKKVQLYGQVLIDNPAESKLGFQGGVKSFNSFGIDNLYLQFELNHALPYTYTTSETDALQTWSHMSAPMAHPFGANFTEFVGIAYYEKKKYFAQLKVSSGIINSIGEGYSNNLLYADEVAAGDMDDARKIYNNVQELYVGHRFNIKTNLTGFISIRNRVHAEKSRVTNSTFISVGMRTNLNNLYYDF